MTRAAGGSRRLPPAAAIVRLATLTAILWICLPALARAWGDEGHEIVALIAARSLEPGVRLKIGALLATDSSGLTAERGIAAESTWADRYRTSHPETQDWHYVDIEIDAASGGEAVPPATHGRIMEKIAQFRATLADPSAPAPQRLFALQFLLHLVGDLHQPLHAADDHDRGGNDVQVVSAGERQGNLHHYWDSVFVTRLGENPALVAQRLLDTLDPATRDQGARGGPPQWALESFRIARDQVYGRLPPADASASHALDAAYVRQATLTVSQRLQLAGLRLARMLNEALREV